MLDKTYDPNAVEGPIFEAWMKDGGFARGERPDGAPFTIVIPPPNVTGSLHMGHALNNTLQDITVRLERMRGRDVLWQPGTDHAGIATQMVVERMLETDGTSRAELGREAFVDKVWEWKAESGDTIIGQLHRLGASCDWSRERFTMDDGLSAAVRKVFVDLYKQGLIYKDQRLVNWDPKLRTAISDLEVQPTDVDGKLWHFRYPIEGEEGRHITVATTRPETMLGDTGVAVHPDDERYADLVGKHAILPLVGRRLRIVADEYADPEQGSGAVKMTPAHDFNDFEVGRRHDLEMINILDADARLNDQVPEAYRGLDRFEARNRVVEDLEAGGYLEKIEPHAHKVPYGDRGGVPIEPWLTEQWYVDAGTLAKPAILAVEEGRTKFVPANWDRTYFEWMRNIQPWCVSRQLWWGHQIPAWYGPDGEIFVEPTEAEAQAAADAHYGHPVELNRDPDVLDTWFSSALWPFSTLGWPERTPELARHYPTNLLVTGFDIIFFWVARMMMMGLHFMDEVPFDTVYIHALVRDERGQKMSKSKGNVMDPLVLIDEFGADAMRFTLAALAAQGRDVKLSTGRIEGYRNFATKLWNAARFVAMNECALPAGFDPAKVEGVVNRWIVGEVAGAKAAVERALDGYRYNEAADAIYHFVWHTYCDWYLEFIKLPLGCGGDVARAAEARATAAWALDQILILLHPFMPFITEELWGRLATRESMLLRNPWPDYAPEPRDADIGAEMDWVIRLVSETRSLRSEMRVPPATRLPFLLRGANAESAARLDTHRQVILRLARLEDARVLEGEAPKGAVQFVLDEATAMLPLADAIDIEGERTRLRGEIDDVESWIGKLDAKLANEKFTSRAPDHVVEAERERRSEAAGKRDKLAEALARIDDAA